MLQYSSGHKRANLHFALDNQAKRYRLYAAGGKAAADLVPKDWRNFVAHQAVENAARLLRVDQVGVYVAGLGEGCLDSLRRNLVKHYAAIFGTIGFPGRQRIEQVLRDGFSLAVRVGRQVHVGSVLSRLAQVGDDLHFAGNDLQRGLKNVFRGDDYWLNRFLFFCLFPGFGLGLSLLFLLFSVGTFRQQDTQSLFGKVQDMSQRRFDGVFAPQILVDCFRLCRRFHNYERTSHVAFVTP